MRGVQGTSALVSSAPGHCSDGMPTQPPREAGVAAPLRLAEDASAGHMSPTSFEEEWRVISVRSDAVSDKHAQGDQAGHMQ